MKTRSELFLWIHLGGIVMFPFFFLLTSVGLTVGQGYSYFVEIPLAIALAILPVLLMQLYRPFNIFSVLFVSLNPQSLSENQRRILALFQRKQQKFVNAIAAVFMLLSLGLAYYLSSTVTISKIADLLPQQHFMGLTIAIVAFFGSNLFFQIPLSALQVLLAKESEIAQIELYTPEVVADQFTTPGIKINKAPWLDSLTSKAEEIN